MYGRSQYEPHEQYVIGGLWLTLAVLLFAGGMVGFVMVETTAELLLAWLVWMLGLVLKGMWVEWWSR